MKMGIIILYASVDVILQIDTQWKYFEFKAQEYCTKKNLAFYLS